MNQHKKLAVEQTGTAHYRDKWTHGVNTYRSMTTRHLHIYVSTPNVNWDTHTNTQKRTHKYAHTHIQVQLQVYTDIHIITLREWGQSYCAFSSPESPVSCAFLYSVLGVFSSGSCLYGVHIRITSQSHGNWCQSLILVSVIMSWCQAVLKCQSISLPWDPSCNGQHAALFSTKSWWSI